MRLLGSLSLGLALLVAGCSSDDGREREQPPRPAVVTPTERPKAPPQVVLSGQGSGIECLEQVRTVQIGYWENTLTASESVRLTSVEALGHGVRVLGGYLVPVVGGEVRSTGVSDWPPTADRQLRRDVAWSQRTALIGGRLPVERAMLPILHLRAVGGGRLDAVVFHVRADDGRTASTTLTTGFRFSRTTC